MNQRAYFLVVGLDTLKKINNAKKRYHEGSQELVDIDLRIGQVGFEDANQVRLPGI